MALRTLLISVPETVQEFTLAARDRLADAEALYRAGRMSASCYIGGYAAEMLLKSACARFRGALATDLIMPYFGPLITMGKKDLPDVDHENRHSIRFWTMILQLDRNRTGGALGSVIDVPFELQFEVTTERVYNNWFVEMRYRREQYVATAALQMIEDVVWLLRNHNDISAP